MPRGKVYVIDDDEAVRDSLQFLLGSVDFEVTLYESAQAFLDALGTLEFGCVVSDVRMPGIDGIEMLRRLKSLGSRFPVIIMTGHGDVPLAVEAMKLGAVDFLEKPFDDDLLITMVDTGLKRAEPELKQEAVTREYDISPRTIEVYRANVMTKMQAGSLSELVRLAMRAGALKD